jgi:hypothetical protein
MAIMAELEFNGCSFCWFLLGILLGRLVCWDIAFFLDSSGAVD